MGAPPSSRSVRKGGSLSLLRIPIQQPDLNPGPFQSFLKYGEIRAAVVIWNYNLGMECLDRLSVAPTVEEDIAAHVPMPSCRERVALDGSKVLASILPPSFESGIEALERFGFILLFIAVFTGVLGVIFRISTR